MLTQIYVKNFILMDEVQLELHDNMSAFTGETGAGKSLLMDAIGILKGDRVNSDMIKEGCDKAVIEGVFELAPQHSVLQQLQDAGHECEDGLLIVTREVTREGRSIARINQRTTTVSFVKQIVSQLVDIHSQHDTQYLRNAASHQLLLDRFARDEDLLAKTKQSYHSYRSMKDALEEALHSDYNEDDLEFLTFQLNEIDEAQLQEEELEAKLDQVSEDYGCDVVVVTEETLDGAVPQDYADDFFDYNDYGMGEDKSGILFLITMSERKRCISTHGEAIQIFTDAGQEYMADNFVSYLSDGEYYEGFMKFADLCEEFIIQAQSGEPYDVENLPEETIPFYMIFLISLVVGFVIALIVTGVMRSRMKTVHMKPDAADYMKDGSLHINRSRDIFLYHQVTRTAKPKEESSGGGGSSTHTSSSGETHGGSSGSF